MKKLLLFGVSVAFAVLANAQVVNMSNEAFNKELKPAFVMPLDYSKKLVDEAVTNRFKADKLKGKSAGAMTLYAKTTYSSMCVSNCDIYTKVDGNGKSATLTIFVARENGNFVISGDDEEQCIKKYMVGLITDIKALELQYQIEEQTKVCEKAQKEYEKLLDKKASLEKDLKNTEKAIQDAEKEKDAQKNILEQLKAKQK